MLFLVVAISANVRAYTKCMTKALLLKIHFV